MKNLTVQAYSQGEDKIIAVRHFTELDNRKSQLHVSKSETESYSKKIKAIHDKVKSASTYVGISMDFEEIDWYDSDCNMYDYPYFRIKKGDRKVMVGTDSTGTIPKDWGKEIVVKFKNCKQYGAVLKAVDALGFSLDAKEVKDLKKALKNGKSFDKEVEERSSRTYW